MSKVFVANKDVYIWANNEIEVKSEYSKWAKEYDHKDAIETLEELNLDTKIYLFTDKHGEKVWHWSVSDEATDVVKVSAKEFFNEYCNEIKSPFVISFME